MQGLCGTGDHARAGAHITWQDDNTLKIETDAGHADAPVAFSITGQQRVASAVDRRPLMAGNIDRTMGGTAARARGSIPLGLGARAGTDSRTLEVTTTRIGPATFARTAFRSVPTRPSLSLSISSRTPTVWTGLS